MKKILCFMAFSVCIFHVSVLYAWDKFLTFPFETREDHDLVQGWRYNQPLNKVNKDPYYHGSIDYQCNEGDPIVSTASGFARQFEQYDGDYGYGHWVFIDHENGLGTLYAHLQAVRSDIPYMKYGNKSQWIWVQRGEAIGWCGMSGTTNVHLHFEVSELYITGRTDPYDVYSTADTYNNGSNCGSNYLWTECPPITAPEYQRKQIHINPSAYTSIFNEYYNNMKDFLGEKVGGPYWLDKQKFPGVIAHAYQHGRSLNKVFLLKPYLV